MKNCFLFILTILFAISSCSKEKEENKDSQIYSSYFIKSLAFHLNNDCVDYNSVKVEGIVARLEKLYLNQDSLGLNDFFSEWNQNIKPNDMEFNDQNIVIESIYKIYETFFLGDCPFTDGYCENINVTQSQNIGYVLIQNRIAYSVLPDVESLNIQTNEYEVIKEFRPKLEHFNDDRILYLTSDYNNAINKFLGCECNVMLTGRIQNELSDDKEGDKRCGFLNKYINITRMYTDINPWLIVAKPYVSFITINEELTKAKIQFIYDNVLGNAVVVKENGEWIVQSANGFPGIDYNFPCL